MSRLRADGIPFCPDVPASVTAVRLNAPMGARDLRKFGDTEAAAEHLTEPCFCRMGS